MKIEAVPFYGLGFALVLGLIHGYQNYTGYTFEEEQNQQHCFPQVTTKQKRLGREAGRLGADEYEAGQLVRYRFNRSKREFTSRVVATQGQTVEIKGGKVLVDGQPIDDPYARAVDKSERRPAILVPAGCIYVINDRRSRGGGDRCDSRSYGPIPVGAITLRFSSKDFVQGGRR